MVDALEARGWLERRVTAEDRRTREPHLTAKGQKAVDRVIEAGVVHEERFTAGLDKDERAALAALLAKLAAVRGLIATAHSDF